MRSFAFLILLAASLGASAFAQSAPARRIDDWGIIALDMPDGETVTIRLAGIELPRPGAPGHVLAMQFTDRELSASGDVSLVPADGRSDRYGNLVADLDLGGVSLAERLVSEGFAMAYSWPETRREGEALLIVEQAAREAGRGLWASGAFAIRTADPNTLALYLETVQIVEGRVIDVAETRDRTYLNFGFDYRTDFTVSIATGDVETFAQAGIDLPGLVGRNVRVRGWIGDINGPSMTLDHPERLEVLTPFEDG